MTVRIAPVVREKRKAKGLTQEALAELIGVSAGYIGQLERSETMPSMAVIAELIYVLGIDANTIFFENAEDMTPANEISLRVSRLSKDMQEILLDIVCALEKKDRKR